jgi:polyhydroxybutyrate depolymerase
MTPYKVWLDKAEAEDIIVAIPNGLFTSEEEKGWNDCRSDAPTNSNADDVQFINNLIAEIANTYQANANRVYISGSSNGGHMCIKLAQELPEKITAFAAIVSSNAVNSECSNSNIPVSALFMNGTNDPLLPYNGGQMTGNRGEVFATENTIDYWVNRNGTNLTPSISVFPNINTNDNSTVEKTVYSNGTNNTEVVLYKVTGGGHTEPSILERYTAPLVPFALGNQNGDIEMVEEVWSFFENKTK